MYGNLLNENFILDEEYENSVLSRTNESNNLSTESEIYSQSSNDNMIRSELYNNIVHNCHPYAFNCHNSPSSGYVILFL